MYLCNLSTKFNQQGQNYRILQEIWVVIIITSSFKDLQVISEKQFSPQTFKSLNKGKIAGVKQCLK